MPLYKYESYSRRGAKVSGSIDASTLGAAKDLLRGQGLMPYKVAEVTVEQDVGFSLTRLFEKKIEATNK